MQKVDGSNPFSRFLRLGMAHIARKLDDLPDHGWLGKNHHPSGDGGPEREGVAELVARAA
jgi:hypothetical protein